MDQDFWLSRWRENRIGFHKSAVNPLLERFWPRVAAFPGRTLVPLCGKSVDLVWLAERGHNVVGLDLSDIAAKSFTAEQGSRAAGVTFLVGDFFDFTSEKIGRFDFVYDRAALIALPEPLRPRYASHLQSLLEPNAHVLLISLEYDPQQMAGPPHSVRESEVRKLFDGRTIDKLHEHDCIEEDAQFKERGLTWMKEVVYHLQ